MIRCARVSATRLGSTIFFFKTGNSTSTRNTDLVINFSEAQLYRNVKVTYTSNVFLFRFHISMCCVFNLWSRNNVHTCGYNPTFRRNMLPPTSKSIKFMCKKSNCSCCHNTALTKVVLVPANCAEDRKKY